MRPASQCCIDVLIVLFVFDFVESRNWSPSARLRLLRLHEDAGVWRGIICRDIDVENVLVDELGGPVGNPGTTMGT